MPNYTLTLPTAPARLYAVALDATLTEVTSQLVVVTPPPPPPPPPPPSGDSTYSWIMPVSGRKLLLSELEVIRDQTFLGDARWGIALNGEVAGRVSRKRYVRCKFLGGRYAAFLENQENVVFEDCLFDVSAPAPAGTNEEACVRVQNCRNIFFYRCTLVDKTGPKHALRFHKECTDCAVDNMTIDTAGNGLFVGTYSGQSENSSIRGLELAGITANVRGEDAFNTGVNGLHVVNMKLKNVTVIGPSARVPSAAQAAQFGWTLDQVTAVRR